MSPDESGRWLLLVAIGTTLFATLLVAFPNYIYSIAGLGWRPTLAKYTGSIVITYAGLGLVAYGGARVSKQHPSLDFRMPTRRDWGVAAGGVIATLLVGGTLVAVASRFSLPIAQPNMLTPPLEGFRDGPSGPERLLAVLPLFVLVVVPVEELLFRTVVQTLLETLLSPEGSIITTTYCSRSLLPLFSTVQESLRSSFPSLSRSSYRSSGASFIDEREPSWSPQSYMQHRTWPV